MSAQTIKSIPPQGGTAASSRSIRILAACLFAFVIIWGAATLDALRDTNIDVDLAVSTSTLSARDAAVWALPLSIVSTGALAVLVWLCHRFIRRIRSN
jgi:hypothetical protein